jgi:hypothetical protein
MSQSIVENLAGSVKDTFEAVENAVSNNFAAQSALTQNEFNDLAANHDAAHAQFNQNRQDTHVSRVAEIEALEASASAEISALTGDSEDGSGLNTIFGAYQAFVDNDNNADTTIAADFAALSSSLDAYRGELGIDEADAILAGLASDLSGSYDSATGDFSM